MNASITGDTTAGGRARLPALLAQHKPGVVIVELGGNDGLRGGNLDSTKDNLDAMVAMVRKADAAPLVSGCGCLPNYGPAYTREFDALFGDVAKASDAALVPFFFAGFAETRRVVPARSHPSDGGRATQASRQCVAGAVAAASRRRDEDRRAAGARTGLRATTGRLRWTRSPRIPIGVDVRSPAEFIDDHIPGAENRPVLDDAERARIGTMYAKESGFAAKRAGAALVARNIAAMLDGPFADKPRDVGARRLLLARRTAQPLARAPAERDRLARRAARGRLSRVASPRDRAARSLAVAVPLRVICGLTGSGKSRLLDALAAVDAQVLDLETLARHRGSLLGDLPDEGQPTQKTFDSGLAVALERFDPRRPVYVESESKRIGTVQVPDALLAAMRTARVYSHRHADARSASRS